MQLVTCAVLSRSHDDDIMEIKEMVFLSPALIIQANSEKSELRTNAGAGTKAK